MRRRDSGVSLMELMIAMAIMVLALLALMSSVFSSSRLVDNSKEKTLAYEAARAKIEEMRNWTLAGSYGQLFTYYTTPANFGNPYKTCLDPLNAGKANKVPVAGLNPIVNNGVPQDILTVYFPVDGGGNLTENPTSPPMSAEMISALGMPKDLNRNGNTTDFAGALNTGYKILPVYVKVQWKGIGGKSTFIEVSTFISEK
jgi:prepilin-type N-terminal cleavage/methylation domain-containing protein